jgi:phosphoglycerate kinase
MRVDFNVAVEKEDAKERYKIFASKETINYILAQEGVKLALIGHLGRPTSLKNCLLGNELLVNHPEISIDSEFSLKQLADDAERILGIEVKFVEDCIGEKVKAAQVCQYRGEVLLLENVRFYCNDEKNDPEFSRRLAENFDVFVSDAFSVCHRDQASVTGAAKILPSYAGFWVAKEIESLEKVKENPVSPAVAIIGGAKIETKLPLIQALEQKYDYILVGGKIANEAIDQGLKFSDKVILPVDFAENRFDIGPKTIEKFCAIIKTAKTIIWNGPLGKFEEEPFNLGTGAVLEAVLGSGAFTLIGGGETVELLEKKNLLDKVSFVSTGGGAMLEYLSGNPMPGIEVLKK